MKDKENCHNLVIQSIFYYYADLYHLLYIYSLLGIMLTIYIFI